MHKSKPLLIFHRESLFSARFRPEMGFECCFARNIQIKSRCECAQCVRRCRALGPGQIQTNGINFVSRNSTQNPHSDLGHRSIAPIEYWMLDYFRLACDRWDGLAIEWQLFESMRENTTQFVHSHRHWLFVSVSMSMHIPFGYESLCLIAIPTNSVALRRNSSSSTPSIAVRWLLNHKTNYYGDTFGSISITSHNSQCQCISTKLISLFFGFRIFSLTFWFLVFRKTR